jgi:TolB-like protein/DNA-binding winged helix-turn-helix (wHTH) protein/Tfp pilus assembly protein PilF
MSSPKFQALRVGEWHVDPALDEISKDGKTVKLEPRAMRLLACLAEHAGQVVSVEQLLDEVWKDVVVTPNSVYHAVATLRRVLGDNTKEPTYIANVLRRGYRLVAPVQWVKELPKESGLPDGLERNAGTSRASATTWLRSRVLWSAAGVLMALLAISFFVTLKPHKLMLVVLPFENLSGDANQEYFSDGMTEELITQLGGLDPEHLGVIARTSAMQYKGAHKDIAQIARELGANYLLEGSIRGSKERIRVTAQLIASGDQSHIWAQNFDRDASDVLRLQSEVARAIAEKIQLALPQATASRLTRSPSLNPEAHEAFLEGLNAENQRTKQSFERAIAAFDRAISLEPQYAMAYAELSRTYSLATVVGLGSSTDMMTNARNAAIKAIQIDDYLATAHTTLGFIHAHFEFDWSAAEKEFRRGIELNASDASAHLFYSNSLLSPLGRHDEAIAEMKIAIRLDPLSAPVDSFLGRTYLWARRYSDALTQLQNSVQRFPRFALNHVRLAHLYTYMNQFDDAIAEEMRAWLLSGVDASDALNRSDTLRLALASNGPHGYWEKVLEFARTNVDAPEAYSNSYGTAILYVRLGETDRAIESLELAFTQRQLAMTEIAVEPAFDSLRSDARFVSLMRRVGVAKSAE